MAKSLGEVQQQSSIDHYMTDLKTCTGHCIDEINLWLLSIEKASKFTGNDPKDIWFTKDEGTS